MIGDEIANIDAYWNQPGNLDMVNASESDTSLTLEVGTHTVPPDSNISQNGQVYLQYFKIYSFQN